MKKSVLYLFTLLCTLSFFTACDDDNDSKSISWENLSQTYEGTKALSLKLGEVTLPLDNKSVAVEASSADKAVVTLNNIIPESKSVQINTTMKVVDGAYTMTGENTVGDCVVSVVATSSSKGMLSVVVNRKLFTPVTGVWNLKFSTVNGNPSAGVYANIVTGNAEIDGMVGAMVGPLVGQLIAQKVDNVTSTFKENGVIGISWKSVGASESVDLSTYTDALSIQYCVVNGTLMVAVDKAYITLIAGLAGSKLEELGLKMEDILAMLVDLGGYYAIPVAMKVENNEATLYLTKDVIIPVVKIVEPILPSLVPEAFKETVEAILPLLKNAQQLDFGLVFTKAN